jgi:hypothetical protein
LEKEEVTSKHTSTMKLTCTLIWLALVGWLLLAFSSCTMSVSPDGAKSFSLDGAQATKAIELLNQK